MLLRTLLLGLLLLVPAACREGAASAPSEAATPPAPAVTQLGPWLQAEAAAGRFSGAVIVARGDRVLFRGAYGPADRGTGERLTPEHRFRLASVSKQFTAAAILQLQDRGVLSVDDPVCRWIQPCPEAWRAVTLHHLLSHQSGVPDLMTRPDWSKLRWRDWTLPELQADSAARPLAFQPGEEAGYSNAAYNLLGSVIERATGRPFAEHLRTALLDPLGLKNTGWDDGSVPLATGYAATAEGLGARRKAGASVVFAAGALYSTVDDMLAWNRALHGVGGKAGTLLSPRSYAQMTAADPARTYGGVERGGVRQTFGYGLFIGSAGRRVTPGFDDRQFFHTGSWSGFRSMAAYQPDADVTVIVLSNNYEGDSMLAAQRAMAEALGRPLPTAIAKRPPSSSTGGEGPSVGERR
jgi:CubicO group peptidase (beta-lactamase class C family)